MIEVLNELGNAHNLLDIAIETPDIEEIVRTFYQQRSSLVAP